MRGRGREKQIRLGFFIEEWQARYSKCCDALCNGERKGENIEIRQASTLPTYVIFCFLERLTDLGVLAAEHAGNKRVIIVVTNNRDRLIETKEC